jgi:hypothetical protein
LYPVIVAPPSFAGAFQKRLIWVDETAVAVRLVGGSGAAAALASFGIDNIMRIEDSKNNVLRLMTGFS